MIFAPQPNCLCCAKIRLPKVQYNANVSALTLIAVRIYKMLYVFAPFCITIRQQIGICVNNFIHAFIPFLHFY